jgi:hypothetical protein
MSWHGLRSWWRGGRERRLAAEFDEARDFDCPTLSRLIRAACEERENTVWWVVVLGASASVYALPADRPPSGTDPD